MNIGEKMYRYPGVRPFSTNEKYIFFGRDEDAKKLYDLILLEKLVVLFAKSGRGKSSLINAAIVPKIEETNAETERQASRRTNKSEPKLVPVEIRLGEVMGDQTSPVDKLIVKLNEVAPIPAHEHPVLDRFTYPFKLWHHFKKIQLTKPRKFLLIFDQFEQFFTYPLAVQQNFCLELAELLYTPIPHVIRENIDKLSAEEYNMLAEGMSVHILISIRSDRLSLLHSMADTLPNILKNRYEITTLTVSQARDAILRPAAIDLPDTFITLPFSYDEEALTTIFDEFADEGGNNTSEIEPFHLQIICQACESKIEESLKKGIADNEINNADLPAFDDLYNDYYQRQLQKIPKQFISPAEMLLENELIYGNEKTKEYRRIPVDKDILIEKLSTMGAPEKLLDDMEQAFLIRREQNSVGGYSYEIAHDSVVEPIINNKKHRQAEENQKKMAELILSKRKIEKERIWGRTFLGLFALMIAALIFYINWQTIYFSYKTATQKSERPIIKNKKDLDRIVNILSDEIAESARTINLDTSLGTWEASQLITALYNSNMPLDESRMVSQYLNLAQKTVFKSSCSWREMDREIDDFRPTAWIASTNGILHLTNRIGCSTIDFLTANQNEHGAWPIVKLSNTKEPYSSTYATCHVLRALNNSLPDIKDSIRLVRVQQAIKKGSNWLIRNRQKKQIAVWPDYQRDANYEYIISGSLSGLAVHTLNLIRTNIKEINAAWLSNLHQKDAAININLKERSDKDYKNSNGVVLFRDGTRHLIIPWQLIATVDAYKDGNFYQKLKANRWIDIVLSNLDAEALKESPRFVKAEILIALRYLQDNNYHFK